MHESLKPIIVESHKRGLPAQWCSDPLEERSIDFRNELSRVLASARRNYGKYGRKQITNIAASEHDEDFTLN